MVYIVNLLWIKIKKKTDDSPHITNRNQKLIDVANIGNLNYLYPTVNLTKPQMRWFKGTRERGLKPDKVA